MKRFLTLALIGAVMLGAGSVAYANVCAFDPVPAATLLFPFVTYNYTEAADGYNTLFAITNVSSSATIAHVTLWTDFSVAILDFNVLLTGYDVHTLSIRNILELGSLPVTVNSGHTADEGVFEDGPVSGVNEVRYGLWDPQDLPDPEATSALGSRCNSSSPGYPGQYTQPIPGNILALFQSWLMSSQTVPRYHTQACSGDPAGTGYEPVPQPWFQARGETDDTWMYITVDVVDTCNLYFPSASQFWQDDEARFENILMGDVIYVNPAARLSEAENAVQIEASASLEFMATPLQGDPGEFASFYARYANQVTNVDDFREPLPTAWAFRYLQDPDNGLTTNIRAFKASTLETIVPDLWVFPSNESPSELYARNCLAYTYYVWDEEENVSSISGIPWSMPGGETVVPNLIPLETQEVEADQFNIIDPFGWFLFIWPGSNSDPADIPDYYQTYMGVQYVKVDAAGAPEYSSFRTGHVMANFNCFEDQVLPQLGILYQPPFD